ncbi:hypothetical protein CVT24_011622 [Panaeolus cyanescens]|uniref:Gylcosyl hydrolase 115 C-terminal domain-containing protein n=1 Tax=Panaeolus cyanescens TaxID=181874 RepID=A0A409YH38_9AGAR|nr:hypothetical protein CVT24_011622 [Panaeolus cyanescens]
MLRGLALILSSLALLQGVLAIGQDTCVTFKSGSGTLPVVNNRKASPILISADDWAGVQLAASDFAADIERVTSVKPSLTNFTASASTSHLKSTTPIIVGTLGKSSLIDGIVNSTKLDVSSIQGKWEAFLGQIVNNPLPGVDRAYVIIGADKRGTIYALYDHSEQFGVSPWYWWADVPTTKQSNIFITPAGCSHGSPTVKYRGIFLNDEQPALQSWAQEKFTNGTGAPFNRFFYTKLFELLLRLKGNYLWPGIIRIRMFAVDDPQNQFLADFYGVAMGTSHQEPMMRSTPNEFSIFGVGTWDYTTNSDNINNYWKQGAERAKPYESVYTLGMRGFGDLPLSEETNIALLEGVIANQTLILQDVYGTQDVSGIPQIWTLYKEVEGYYEDGLRVPDYVTLLWADDNWGNIRRFPVPSERSRSGGAGVYYHFDYVGDPRDYKWITTTQIEKVHQQMSIAVQRQATNLWIVNVGDLKPYERETEFFLSYGWNASRWTHDNLDTFVSSWAQREFDISKQDADLVTNIVGNLTRWNARRKPELLNSTTFSLINYREAETVLSNWAALEAASTSLYNRLPSGTKPAFYQLIQHAVIASANMAKILIYAGQNNMRASQARLSTNNLADSVEEFFEKDFDFETQYNTLLNGKWNHMMDQTHLGYYYWQQPMTNTMPPVNRVQKRKNALAGVMRIVPENTLGAWPGDNSNQCAQGYNCPPPTVVLDNFSPISNRYIDVGAGGPIPFTFTATTKSSWLKLSPASGSVSPSSPETRVFASVSDWSQLKEGTNTATITFVAKAKGQPDLSVNVIFNAVKNTPAAGFKGFVEGTGVVSIEAAHASRKTTVDGITWTEMPRLGRTLSGISPLPLSDKNFGVGAGPTLEYDFYNFNTLQGQGNVTVHIHITPALNANTDQNPLAFTVGIDNQAPVKVVPIGPQPPGGLPASWGGPDGYVANSIITTRTTFNGVNPGAHTLKIGALEPAVVIQKIVINTGGLLPSYLGPPESIRV